MLKRLLVSAALAGAALVAPLAASGPASAAAHAASCYRQVGNHWNCVTPGAYCPKAAHGKYGSTATKRRYKCSEYSNHQWRWKRA